MIRVLHAWMDGAHVGVFERSTDDTVRFTYDERFTLPISLSLPRSGDWSRRAPANFLENLLPDNPATRAVMARHIHAASTDTFDLLDQADTSGGIVFSSQETPPQHATNPLQLASQEEIIDRIISVAHNSSAWWSQDTHARFSLGGNQPKFALQYRDGLWFYSDAAHPSTHIFKPYDGVNQHATEVEQASMRLAKTTGLPVANSDILHFDNLSVYVTERFDRTGTGEHIQRLHTEDFAQALGIAPAQKYQVKPKAIVRLLHEYDPTDTLVYDWVAQLALNTAMSNADAHAKNYSLIWNGKSISLSPMYDVITTTFWPHVSRTLAMRIGGATGAKQVTPHHWARFAQDNHLDENKVVTIARQVAYDITTHASEIADTLPDSIADRWLKQIETANTSSAPQDSGLVYVRPHMRGGTSVSGYYRHTPAK